MNFLFVTSVIAFYWGICISILVFFYGQNRNTRITFGLLAASLTIWIYCDFFYYTHIINYIPVVWVARITQMGAVFIPPLYLHFISTVIKKQINRYVLAVLYSISLVFFFLMGISNLMIEKVHYLPSIPQMNITTGFLYNIWIFYLFVCLGGGYVMLIKAYRTAKDYLKAQIEYLFLAIIASIASASVYFLTIFGITVPRIDNLFLCIYSSIITYAIIKHRLVDIVLVIRRSIVYLILVSTIVFVMSGTVLIFGRIIEEILHLGQWVTTVLTSFIIVVVFQPLKDIIAQVTDKIFFQAKYNYQLILRDLSQRVGTIVDYNILIKELTEKIATAIKVKNTTLLLFDKKANKYLVEGHYGEDKPKATLRENDDLIDYFKRNRNVLVYYEIVAQLEKEETEKIQLIKKDKAQVKGMENFFFKEALKKSLEIFHAVISVPIYIKGKLIGILFLGPKLSDDIYTGEDINLLETLASQAGVALENSRLITDIIDLKNYNENVLKHMGSGVITVDINGQIVSFNDRAEEITRIKTTNAIGKNIEILYPLSSRFRIFKETINNKNDMSNIETELIIKDITEKVPVALNTAVIFGSQLDDVIGVVGEVIDLTEIKKLQMQIERNDRLASLGTMAAGIAHEIKNPMVSLKTFTQMMPKMFDNEEFRQKYNEIVPSQVERINDLMTALLHIGKPQKVQPAKIDINDAIREVLLLCESDRKNYDAEIIREYSGELYAFADKNQMIQVVLNLARNALQAMPKGGKLTVSTRSFDKDFVEIKISDTGIGIPKENLAKLFDPFFSTKEEGTGLGLSIVYKIIQEHRGRIDVESIIGQGTTFLIYLPKE